MSEIEGNGKAKPKEEKDGSLMGSSPSASKIFAPTNQTPIFKKDLYADLEKIEERGKRKKGFSLFGRNKK
ncbi:MAG: hypothetical protein KAJ33_05200 [Thermoplasmata archaeon]|nr:hypothetical protein [Thermoplasmata archaeon]